MKAITNFLFFLMALFACNQAFPSIIIYDSLSELKSVTSNLIVEDWSDYPRHTLLSDQTINGITYQSANSLGEPIVTRGCQSGGIWCIDHLTDSGGSRSFGSRPVTFWFEDPIDAFSLYLVQGINQRLDGSSIWEISFDSGEKTQIISNYTTEDSRGLGYIGLTGLNSATEVSIRQTRNDPWVVWSFNHIGYQAVAVDEPSSLLITLSVLIIAGFRRHSTLPEKIRISRSQIV